MPTRIRTIHIAAKPIGIDRSHIRVSLKIIKLMCQLTRVNPLVITGTVSQITTARPAYTIKIIAYNPKITLTPQIAHLARIPPRILLTNSPGAIGAAIITDYNLKRPLKHLPKHTVERTPDSVSLIISNHNYANIHKLKKEKQATP